MEIISRVAVERAMTIQEVILMAMAKRLTWMEASQVFGLYGPAHEAGKARYERQGFHGLYDGRCGKLSPRRITSEVVEEVLRLYRDQYFDFNVVHFHEKLIERHDLKINYTWTKSLLQISVCSVFSVVNLFSSLREPGPIDRAAVRHLIAESRERGFAARENVSLSRGKISMSRDNAALSREKMTFSREISIMPRGKMSISRDVEASSRAERASPRDATSPSRARATFLRKKTALIAKELPSIPIKPRNIPISLTRMLISIYTLKTVQAVQTSFHKRFIAV